MKTVEWYKGTEAVEICITGYYWLNNLKAIMDDAKRLKHDVRLICKRAGIGGYDGIENDDNAVSIDLSAHNSAKIFVTVSAGGSAANIHDGNARIVAEAVKRHYRQTI